MLQVSDKRQDILAYALLTALALVLYAIRLTGPVDLEADAQQRVVGYVMDAVWRGNWLVQTEVRGWLMSKPPLHTWMAAMFGTVGGVNRLTLTLPSALAVLGMSLLVYQAGRRHCGASAGWYAGLACLLAPLMSRHIALVRTDALFACAITAAALAAYHAWQRGSGWLPFWLAGAAATLIKGPLGPLLAAAGLLAYFWERRTDPQALAPRGQQVPGIALFLILTAGWLALATYFHGHALIDKLFFDELFGQVTGARKDITPGENFYKPSFFFILRFLPFSLFACYGMWRVIRRPANNPDERRFERFLLIWIAFGLLLFSLGAHFRADLIVPLWPAAALLAGRELARLGQKIGKRSLAFGMGVVALALIGLVYWGYHPKAMKSKEIQYSIAIDQAGRALAASRIDPQAILYLDTPPLAMMHIGAYHLWTTEAEAERLLKGREPVCILVSEPDKFPRLFGPDTPSLHSLFRWPSQADRPLMLGVFANTADAPCMR